MVEKKSPGKKSPKNKLNDLTGSEWTHFLCSVEVTNFPTSGTESYAHKLRKQHPSPKPPQLMKQIIGGLNLKVDGAKKAGIKTVLCPKENEEDLIKIREGKNPLEDEEFKIVMVEHISEVLNYMLL